LVALVVSALATHGRLDGVTALRVSKNGLSVMAPSAVGGRPPVVDMTALAAVCINHANLRRVPAPLAAVAATLRHLDLANNHLRDLPPWFRHMTALRTLVVDCNWLTEVPPSLRTLTALTRLELTGNSLDALPEWFGTTFARLRRLDLCSAFEHGPRLPASFARLARLRHLSLCCSPTLDPAHRSWSDPGARQVDVAMWPEVYGLVRLRSLVLCGSHVSRFDARIARLDRLTRIEGLMALTSVPAEIGRLVRLRRLDMCRITCPRVPHELEVVGERMDMDEDSAPIVRVTPDPGRDVWPVVTVPPLIDLCLTYLARQPPPPPLPSDRRRIRSAPSVSVRIDDGVGGDPTSKRYRTIDVDGGGDSGRHDAAAEPWHGHFWCDGDDGNGDDCESDSEDSDTSDEPFGADVLPRGVRDLLPVELVERAGALWSRSCAACRRPIIGTPPLIEVAYLAETWLDVLNARRLPAECAYCATCASPTNVQSPSPQTDDGSDDVDLHADPSYDQARTLDI